MTTKAAIWSGRVLLFIAVMAVFGYSVGKDIALREVDGASSAARKG
jgi:hypothetical protein